LFSPDDAYGCLQTILATAGFLEEVFPFTDAIPSATIGWLLEFSSNSVGREVMGAADLALRQRQQHAKHIEKGDKR
jgi:hypothetical protein